MRGRGEMHAGLWWGKCEWQEPLGRTRRRWRDNIEIYFQVMGWEAWTGLIWLSTRICGGVL